MKPSFLAWLEISSRAFQGDSSPEGYKEEWHTPGLVARFDSCNRTLIVSAREISF